MLLFPSEDWGADAVVQNRLPDQAWPDFLAQTPFSAEAQAGIARIQTDLTSDWITLKDGPKTDQEKKAILSRITQKQYYMDYIGVPEEAIVWYQRNGHSLLGAGAQAISAADMWALGSRVRGPRPELRQLPGHRAHPAVRAVREIELAHLADGNRRFAAAGQRLIPDRCRRRRGEPNRRTWSTRSPTTARRPPRNDVASG